MSIVTQKINTRPRFTQALVNQGVFKSSPLSVIDVGARGGFEEHWQLYKDQIKLIGFELDEAECRRLNQKEVNANKKYYPVALDKKRGKRKFYVQPHLASSSFYESDPQFLSRFPASGGFLPNQTVAVPTIGLDEFLKEQAIQDLDFIKLDVEGAELDVFKGATKALKNLIFGLSAEAAFLPWRHKLPTFTDIDLLLRRYGFKLYDLPIMRWERKSLSPYKFEEKVLFGPTDRGQAIWTQAVYLRDAVAELQSGGEKRQWWNRFRILKLASIMELFNLEDCAIELIQEAAKLALLDSNEADRFIDLLTPPLNGQDVTYAEFVEHLKREGPPRWINGKKVTQAEFDKYKAGQR